MTDFTLVLDALFYSVLDTGDFKQGGDHQMELSPYVLDCLRYNGTYWMNNFHMHPAGPGQTQFQGMFFLKPVYELIDREAYRLEQNYEEVMMGKSDHFEHLALRVERDNGRFRYFDWEGNREEMK